MGLVHVRAAHGAIWWPKAILQMRQVRHVPKTNRDAKDPKNEGAEMTPYELFTATLYAIPGLYLLYAIRKAAQR